jgi:hypothetical protein
MLASPKAGYLVLKRLDSFLQIASVGTVGGEGGSDKTSLVASLTKCEHQHYILTTGIFWGPCCPLLKLSMLSELSPATQTA